MAHNTVQLIFGQRLSRFLANKAIDVRSWYKPIAKAWLQSQFERVGEVRLIVDGTKVGFGHQLLMVSLAYRRRAVPIAWTWVKYVRGHSSGQATDQPAQVCGEPAAQGSTRFCGRRQRIWLDFGAAAAGSMALVLCFASERQHRAVAATRKWTGREWKISFHKLGKVPGVRRPT